MAIIPVHQLMYDVVTAVTVLMVTVVILATEMSYTVMLGEHIQLKFIY